MAKGPKRPTSLSKRKNRRGTQLLFIPLLALLIKIFIIIKIQGFDWYGPAKAVTDNGKIISRVTMGLGELLDKNFIPAHAWYGADGENYIRGLWELSKNGLFSPEGKLAYWPAGYPLLMLPLLLVFKGEFFGVLAFLQSALYAAGCIFFVDEIRRSRLTKFAIPLALFLSFNPTLALNTIAVGYELPVVALTLVSTAAMMRFFRLRKTQVVTIETVLASTSYSIASLMQPRLLVIAFVALLIWGLAAYRIKTAALFLLFSLAVVAIAPATMILRNQKANGFSAISTNLGVTMGIGAGPEATGGYNGKYNGVPCPAADKAPNAAAADNAKVRCILSWYVHNPVSTLKLSWNKSVYFWSPWVGPAANGTMARNPWALNHPIIERVKTENGVFLALKGSGQPIPWTFFKTISWAWMLATLIFMIYGFRILWRAKDLERLIGVVALSVVLLNWLSSVATIGDHRFRIPSMGMSLFLQVIGFFALFIKGRDRFFGPSTPVSWLGLRWKGERATDNLAS